MRWHHVAGEHNVNYWDYTEGRKGKPQNYELNM